MFEVLKNIFAVIGVVELSCQILMAFVLVKSASKDDEKRHDDEYEF